jgi:hypothetical protein
MDVPCLGDFLHDYCCAMHLLAPAAAVEREASAKGLLMGKRQYGANRMSRLSSSVQHWRREKAH